jgi:hypothetical protein
VILSILKLTAYLSILNGACHSKLRLERKSNTPRKGHICTYSYTAPVGRSHSARPPLCFRGRRGRSQRPVTRAAQWSPCCASHGPVMSMEACSVESSLQAVTSHLLDMPPPLDGWGQQADA